MSDNIPQKGKSKEMSELVGRELFDAYKEIFTDYVWPIVGMIGIMFVFTLVLMYIHNGN